MDWWHDPIKPMLIGAEGKAFDNPDYIYELKLDGERCIALLGDTTELRNKRSALMLSKFPELTEIHKQVRRPCILDGELMVSIDGKPNFAEVQRRSLMSNSFKIDLAARQTPASFVAYDILWYDGAPVINRPLMERKALLQKAVKKETDRLAISRYIEGRGVALYELAEAQGLEGIVAKRRDSLYYLDKRTKDWIKAKNLQDDDFVVCGYIHKARGVTSLVLGQYDDAGALLYKGHVTLGVGGASFERIAKARTRKTSPFKDMPAGNENAVWLSPALVCTVKYMELTTSGSMRQPVFKGLREDKTAKECRAQK